MINDIAIVGMGALGLLYGSHFFKTLGSESVRFVMDAARLKRHQSDIYTINGQKFSFWMQDAGQAMPADLVIVATKYGALNAALAETQRLVDDHTIIISVLNGITSEKMIMERYGSKNALGCVALGMDAVREGTALTYTHQGLIKIGTLVETQEPVLAQVAELFERTRLPHTVEMDIYRVLWAKLLLNVGINQTCMVYETDYGGAFTDETARQNMFAAMHEVIAVAAAEGVNLTETDFQASLKVLKGLAPRGTPSMRQDALAKRPSEVELFSGTIVALGKQHNIATPVNEFYYRRIKEIESKY